MILIGFVTMGNFNPQHSSMPNATSPSQIAEVPTTTLSLAIEAVASAASAAAYGSVVDTIDTTPAMYAAPGVLPERDTGTPVVDGDYSLPFYGSLGGSELLSYRGNYLNITGKGYSQIRWEVAWFNTYGLIVPPTWTALAGKLFHVASGGDGGAPVPQFTTHLVTFDILEVPMDSEVALI